MTPEQQRAIAIANARKRQAEGVPAESEGDFSAREMVGNIPSSAYELVKNIITPILSPIETGKAVGKSAAGALYKGNELLRENTPEWMGFLAEPIGGGEEVFGEDEEVYAEAIKQAILDRYGSIDKAKETIEQDPVGFMADISGVITGGAMLAPGKAGTALRSTGAAIDPVNLSTNAGKYALGRMISKSLPEGMYESAAKFRTALTPDQRKALTRTALDEQLMPTSKGLGQLDMRIDALGKNIDGLVDSATESGVAIPKSRVYKYLKDVRQELGGAKLNAPQDLRKIDQVVKSFDTYMKQIGKDTLTPRELQSFKQDAYKRINWNKQNMVTGSYPKEAATKAMARAAKDELEKVSPEIASLNARQGRLLNLRPELERSAARIENRDIMGIGMPIKAAAGQAAGGPIGAAAMTGQAIFDVPQVKSKAALMAERLRTTGMEGFMMNNPNNVMARQALIQSGRIQDLQSQDPIIRALRSQSGGQF